MDGNEAWMNGGLTPTRYNRDTHPALHLPFSHPGAVTKIKLEAHPPLIGERGWVGARRSLAGCEVRYLPKMGGKVEGMVRGR